MRQTRGICKSRVKIRYFTRPRNTIETRLRLRHLAHHVGSNGMIFGVTNSFWDRVFGTEPAPQQMQQLEKAAETIPVLTGPSNWKRMVTIWQQALMRTVASR